jgi:capsular exopolysaccharide synthesis family protein
MDALSNAADSPEVKLHFLDYWRVIRLRKSLIFTVFLLCVISSAILSYCLPKQYSSTVRMEVQKDAPEVQVVGSQASLGWDPYWLTTQFRIITAWDILCPVITNKDLNLQHVLAHDVQESDWTLDQTYKVLSRKVSVDQTRGTSLIEISVRNPDSDMAAAIANKIAETYKQYRFDSWWESKKLGLESFQRELDNKREALSNETANLDNLRKTLDIPELDDSSPQVNATIYSEKIRILESRYIEAQLDYNDHSNILANLQSLDKQGILEQALPTVKGQVDQDLFVQSERVAHAQDVLTEASERGYGADHPVYVAAFKNLNEAKSAYHAKVQGIMSGWESVVAHDKALLDFIAQQEDEAKRNSNEEARRDREYFTEKRNVEATTRTYEELDRLYTQQNVEAHQPLRSTVIIHDPARPDKRPVSPRLIFIIPSGILMGLIVGVGLAFFIEYLDTSVKTIDDVERALQAPVLGVIPQNVGNVMEEGPESPHAEAYRVLRTNLLFSRKDENWNTITVLSGGAGEGKTTTLFNLAVVFAQNGQRVLLVDSDLRRPNVHRMLRCSNAIGLTDLLLNKQITLDQVLQKTKLPTLDFLPSGKLPSSSMSILASAQMKDAIRELKRRYDFVFFDAPPLLGVSDASILASEMDMVIQVIQYRRYPTPMTLRAKQMIQKVGGNLMGLVLNNINMSQDENYYYYSGYYEYDSHSPKSDSTVVQLSDAAGKPKIEIKQKY